MNVIDRSYQFQENHLNFKFCAFYDTLCCPTWLSRCPGRVRTFTMYHILLVYKHQLFLCVSAIPAVVLVLGVIVILIVRRRCPRRFSYCLGTSLHMKYEIFNVESALEAVVVDACSSSGYVPLQAVYTHSSISTSYPLHTSPSMNATIGQNFPSFSRSSQSGVVNRLKKGLTRETPDVRKSMFFGYNNW